jgi:hypothetical protein
MLLLGFLASTATYTTHFAGNFFFRDLLKISDGDRGESVQGATALVALLNGKRTCSVWPLQRVLVIGSVAPHQTA